MRRPRTATDAIRALETCAITETEALRRTGAESVVAMYRMAILELAPHLAMVKRREGVQPERRRARAA